MKSLIYLSLVVLVCSPKLQAYNSFRVKNQPNEVISNHAQISYKELFTSAGSLKTNIHALVGLVDHYGIFKLSCATNGGVKVDHNILTIATKTMYLDGRLASLEQNSEVSSQLVKSLKNTEVLSFEQPVTNFAGEGIPAKQVISLEGFAASYTRVTDLCNEQKKVTASLRL
ncbi:MULTISPECIES: hypothetical protein [unclassified Agarivorans]|uniref:hypothetical protein n=1 Tax=unclassified Agarivorans TaxID=2636026 RepID=UPI0026E1402E|nr:MULTISPECIES: hypothetical protein [unclassified Agarivorans]MDO6684637.1 hypothetical protein [Agarivorans sp. 3_MG-2023]MDO6714802.1 hypothetical protein [Agarivorans sp. 2_MG-2023]